MFLTVFKTSVSSALLHTLGVVNECKFTKGELLYNVSMGASERGADTSRSGHRYVRDVVSIRSEVVIDRFGT